MFRFSFPVLKATQIDENEENNIEILNKTTNENNKETTENTQPTNTELDSLICDKGDVLEKKDEEASCIKFLSTGFMFGENALKNWSQQSIPTVPILHNIDYNSNKTDTEKDKTLIQIEKAKNELRDDLDKIEFYDSVSSTKITVIKDVAKNLSESASNNELNSDLTVEAEGKYHLRTRDAIKRIDIANYKKKTGRSTKRARERLRNEGSPMRKRIKLNDCRIAIPLMVQFDRNKRRPRSRRGSVNGPIDPRYQQISMFSSSNSSNCEAFCNLVVAERHLRNTPARAKRNITSNKNKGVSSKRGKGNKRK